MLNQMIQKKKISKFYDNCIHFNFFKIKKKIKSSLMLKLNQKKNVTTGRTFYYMKYKERDNNENLSGYIIDR